MFNRQRKKEVPALNTTSTADISFMLLIFFLVTSSMDTDKGLTTQLPPPENTTMQQEQAVKERNVLRLAIDDHDVLTVNGDTMATKELAQRVAEFVGNEAGDASLPEMSDREVHLMGRCKVSDRHIIIIEASRLATYNTYFEMQNAIARGYNSLREKLAQRRFGLSYAACSQEQRDAIAMVYPKRISENIDTADRATDGNSNGEGGTTP